MNKNSNSQPKSYEQEIGDSTFEAFNGTFSSTQISNDNPNEDASFNDLARNEGRDCVDISPPRKTPFLNDTKSQGTLDTSLTELVDQQTDHEETKELKFGDYETYFYYKKLKQQEKDEQYVQWRTKKTNQFPPIFSNCVIYVNGRTDPDITQLHRMIILHGGVFLNYLGAKSNATHVIASNITPRKILEFRNFKVIKPEWITDSIKEKKLLDWTKYTLLNSQYGQKGLESHCDQKEKSLPPNRPIDATHPEFLKFFFENSRLHHLSTWKADLREKFQQEALKVSKMSQTFTTQRKIIIHIDFDCFFAAVSALSHPNIDFANEPIAVSHGGKGSSDVSSCNYAARKFGVSNGMWVNRALELCPELKILDYDFKLYEEKSKIFYGELTRMGPDCIFPVSVDEALIELSSIDDEGSALMNICEKLRNNIYVLTGCTVSIGASYNVLLAKLCLRKAKPNGVFFFFQPNDVGNFLKNIPVKQLPGIGHKIEDRLANHLNKGSKEIVTISDLNSVSRDTMVKFFGIKTGTKLFDYCQGLDDTDIDISKNPSRFIRKSISIDVNWGIRFENQTQVDDFLGRVADHIYQRLLRLGFLGSRLMLKLARRTKGAPIDPPKYLGMGLCDFLSKSTNLGAPTREVGLIATELKSLYRMIGVAITDLRGVSVTISELQKCDSEANSVMDQRQLQFEAKKPKEKEMQGIEQNLFESGPFIPHHSPAKKTMQKLLQKHLVDLDTFKALPNELQQEIKFELERRNVEVLFEKSPRKNRNRNCLLRDGSVKKISKVQPKTQNKRLDLIGDQKLLNKVILNTPVENLENSPIHQKTGLTGLTIGEQKTIVLNSYWASAKMKTFNKLYGLGIQTFYEFEDWKNLLRDWIRFSFESENEKPIGIHENDLDVFYGFIHKLILNEKIYEVLSLADIITCSLSSSELTSNDIDNENDWRKIRGELSNMLKASLV
ncbi:BA75_02381T0 [Komagataella pastoris]|uniref:DNA repair protein REV1 n=1 Tax=Komagataella pastoris TaxID=4922 RepID=A0A1B2JBP5_PICPA|nr:BA75_02381T0 [Komagataella pastoris]